MNKQHSPLLKKDATQSILASILSIIIGLMVGCIIILIVGLTSDNLTLSSALDGIQLIFGGLFSTGRDAAGTLGIPSESVPAGLIWIIAFVGGCLAGAVWGAIPGLLKAFLNINEVLACIMTNWLAANLVTWMFDISNFKNVVENTKSGYIYKTSFNGVETPKMGLDHLFPNSQVNMGIIIAIVIAILMYIIMNLSLIHI